MSVNNQPIWSLICYRKKIKAQNSTASKEHVVRITWQNWNRIFTNVIGKRNKGTQIIKKFNYPKTHTPWIKEGSRVKKGREAYAALGNSSFPGGGSQDDQWLDQSLESKIQRCILLSLRSPSPPPILLSWLVFHPGTDLFWSFNVNAKKWEDGWREIILSGRVGLGIPRGLLRVLSDIWSFILKKF